MSDNPLDRIPVHNRVSIRAVLVQEGEDQSAALAASGIVNSVAIPVVMGDTPDLPGGILGNGMTPNLVAVLETEQGDDFDESGGAQAASVGPSTPDNQPSRAGTATSPSAYGMQSLAPIRS